MTKNKEDETVAPRAKVRISPRISRGIYALAKTVYPLMGVTLEERNEESLVQEVLEEKSIGWAV